MDRQCLHNPVLRLALKLRRCADRVADHDARSGTYADSRAKRRAYPYARANPDTNARTYTRANPAANT